MRAFSRVCMLAPRRHPGGQEDDETEPLAKEVQVLIEPGFYGGATIRKAGIPCSGSGPEADGPSVPGTGLLPLPRQPPPRGARDHHAVHDR